MNYPSKLTSLRADVECIPLCISLQWRATAAREVWDTLEPLTGRDIAMPSQLSQTVRPATSWTFGNPCPNYKNPNLYTSFANIKIGPIGSTFSFIIQHHNILPNNTLSNHAAE
jgi:hypothetical protein